jgi:hypothetical protein
MVGEPLLFQLLLRQRAWWRSSSCAACSSQRGGTSAATTLPWRSVGLSVSQAERLRASWHFLERITRP